MTRRSILRAAGAGLVAAAAGGARASWAQALPPAQLTIAGAGAGLGTMTLLADAFGALAPQVRIRVLPGLGTAGGLKAMLAGDLSIAVSSRAADEGEQARGARSLEFARTPFVFATRLATPVDDVTLDELAALYGGRRIAWRDGTPVRPVLRPLADGDTRLVSAMSPALAAALQAAHEREGRTIAITDTDAASHLERVPGSIGTATLALILSEQRRLKPLTLAGVRPGLAEMDSGRYPYRKSLFAVARADAGVATQAFLDYVGSAPAAAILRDHGSLPVARRGVA